MSNPQTSARAFWLYPPGGSGFRDETLPEPGPDQVCVRTRFTAVSRGTETRIYAGAVPESEYERMRAPFQTGTLPGPVKHGYANVGVIEAGPAELIGRDVFCLYPHQTRYVVAADAVIVLPADVPPQRAVLAANMETAINGLWDARPAIGDRITVVGAGVIGALLAGLCARLPGVDVQMVDIDPDKAEVASQLGARFASPDTADGDRDLLLHASTSSAGLETALHLAGFEATIIEMSWFGSDRLAVPLGGAFHSQRLTLRSSQVGAVSPVQRPRWTHRRRLELAVSLLADARFDALFAADVCFDELPQVMARLARPGDSTLCQRIVYEQP